jgi:hypothetical protein
VLSPDIAKIMFWQNPMWRQIDAWGDRRFGMFIHLGLYPELGGVRQGGTLKRVLRTNWVKTPPCVADA